MNGSTPNVCLVCGGYKALRKAKKCKACHNATVALEVKRCLTCDGNFKPSRQQLARGQGKYCSYACRPARKPPRLTGRNNPNYVESVCLVCHNCQQTFERKPNEVKRPSRGKYCSVKCRDEHKALYEAGEKSPYWVGGPKTYRGRTWTKVRSIVVERQKGRCVACRKFIGKSLPVHHIRPFREFESAEEANAFTNLIGLCQPCHVKSEYGKLRLTKQVQFVDLLELGEGESAN